MEQFFLCQAMAVLSLLLASPSLSAVCTGGRFGFNCTGYCHCKNKTSFNQGCNPYTGRCFRDGCEPRYIGKYCEFDLKTKNTVELKEDGMVPADVIHKDEGKTFTFECILKTTEWSLAGLDSINIEKRPLNRDTMAFKNINKIKSIETPFFETGRFNVVGYDVAFSSYNVYLGNAKLRISALKVEDSGTYRCTLVRNHDNIAKLRFNSSEVTLVVLSNSDQTGNEAFEVKGKSFFVLKEEGRIVPTTVIRKQEGKSITVECIARNEMEFLVEGGFEPIIQKRDDTLDNKNKDPSEIEDLSFQPTRFKLGKVDVGVSGSFWNFNAKMTISELKVEDSGKIRCIMKWTRTGTTKDWLVSPEVTFNVVNTLSTVLLSPFRCYCKRSLDCNETVPPLACTEGCVGGHWRKPPECQGAIPILQEPPVLLERTENLIKFKFKQWNWNTDSGYGPPNSYRVELKELSTKGNMKFKGQKEIEHKSLTEIEATGAWEVVTLKGVLKQTKYDVRVCSLIYHQDSGLFSRHTPKASLIVEAKNSQVHDGWGSWQQWESCGGDSTTYGLESRKRDCDAAVPSSETELCEGNMDEYRKCSPSKGMDTVKKKIQGPKPILHMAYREAVAVKFIHPTAGSDEHTPDLYEIEYREVGQKQPHLLDKAKFVTMKNEKTETIAYIPVRSGMEYDVNVFAAYHFGGNKLQRIAGKASETLRIKGGQGCRVGFFGKDCANKCHCEGDKPCSEVSGQCPGECDTYYAKDQYGACTSHKGCPAGWWGDKCRNKCNCENDVSCENTKTGECPGGTCRKRFTGDGCSTQTKCKVPKVYGPDCDIPCNCLNDAQCDDYTGKCVQCPPGFSGENCSIKPKCPDGWYGAGCGKKCDCDPGQPCNQLGQCETKTKCPDNTFGEQCKYKCDCSDPTAVCPPEILGCESNCKSASKHSCKVTCAGGRYGEDCSKWCNCSVTIDCVDGICKEEKPCENPKKYGSDCELDCQCAEGDTCSRAEGLCKTCEPLRYGENCGRECGCLNASLCNTSTGSCQGTCLKGRWGLDCQNECLCEDCNSITGKCTGNCPDGRYGARCENECHCKDKKPCKISTGCHGCAFGYRGYHCNLRCFCKYMSSCSQYSKCPQCPSGRYGLTCEHECDGCLAGDCDRYTGECRRGCKPERWGAGCKNKCACRIPGTCNPVDGHCTSGCVKGRTGPACSNLCYCEKDEYCVDNTCNFQCPKYHFGHDCRNVSHCPPGDTYDMHTGRCSSGICDEGFFGPACSSRCHCKENRCRPTGECLQGGCAEGWYGPSCSHRCNCVDRTKCDSATGACEKCPVGWYGIDCSKQCFCRESAACDRHTGFCPNGCPPFRHGLACDTLCYCYDGDICERFSGTCCKPSKSDAVCFKEPMCKNNTFGPSCEKQSNCLGNFNRLSGKCNRCKTGYYGFACENQCHCKGNAACSSDGNRCASGCEVGWFGFYCEKPCHCYKKAPCEKGKCNMGCEPGWWGYSCDSPCNCESSTCNQDTGYCDGECIPGKFGYSCDQQCFCPEGGRCMRKTGKCAGAACPPKRFGYGCQKQCHCLLGSECIKGVCKKGCDKGWSGPYCQRKCNCHNGICNSEKCEKCLPGTFGARCERICHCADKCNELTNECGTCPPGKWGLDCQKECHCNFNFATSCDRMSGKCPMDCQDGFFGYACNKRCHCDNGGKCHQFTGECLNELCELGYYGLGCQSKCNCARACDQKTGQCNDGCLFRRYGENCKKESQCAGPFDSITGRCTTVCRPGWYGFNCAQKCNCDEETFGYCHPATGECSNDCPPTYYGHNCKSRCYCLDNNGRCPRDTGQCSNCTHGWFGPRCDTRCHCRQLESCPGGTCPSACEQGWTGKGCSEPIPCSQPNRFGQACTMVCHCLENKPCHRFTGICNKCKPRWKGDTCSHFEACDKPNVYGENCESECQCLNPDDCDSVTGSCGGICPPRRQGDKCDLPTACTLPGTFGEKCEHKCHCNQSTCDYQTGSCKDHGGCAKYFSGDNCSTFEIPESDIGLGGRSQAQTAEAATKENVITITVGGVCALVVICCIALAIFVCVAKTHKSRLNLELADDDDETDPEVNYANKMKRSPQISLSSITGSNVENTSVSSSQETLKTYTETSSEGDSNLSGKEEQ